MPIKTFYSFHYKKDVWRVQQIRNIHMLTDNPPIKENEWEEVRKSKEKILAWIDSQIKTSDCVVVLIGSETSYREYVLEEIRIAWQNKKPMLGIYIHNIRDSNAWQSTKGNNPFDQLTINNGQKRLSTIFKTYELPGDSASAYGKVRMELHNWVDHAIRNKPY